MRKMEKIVAKYPEFVRKDTIRDTILIQGEQIINDSMVLKIDSTALLNLESKLDSISSLRIEYSKKQALKESAIVKAIKIDPLVIDEENYSGRIWIENGKIMADIKSKDRSLITKTPCDTIVVEKSNWIDSLWRYAKRFWWMLVIALLIIYGVKVAIKGFFR